MRYITIFCSMILLASCLSEPVTYNFDLQGHRGTRGHLPENTIPGFLKAIDYGVDTIEFDVVVTRDKKLIISHEPWFSHKISTRPDGIPVTEEEQKQFNIYKMKFDETREFDVGKRGHPDFPEQKPMEAHKPRMKDAILAVENYIEKQKLEPVQYNIEMKSVPELYGEFVPEPAEFARLLYHELGELDILDRVIIQSFDPNTLIEFREIDPEVKQAILVNGTAKKPIVAFIEELGYVPEIWSPASRLVTPNIVKEAHELGMKVIPWTVNKPKEMKKLLEMGVDGIITDFPDRALELKP